MINHLYGISNCDTVKKAKKWLDEHHIAYQFHDFRKDGLSEDKITDWINQAGLETVINKRSTSWRNLDDETRAGLSEQNAPALLAKTPTLIKRPVLESDQGLTIGFNAEQYASLFGL